MCFLPNNLVFIVEIQTLKNQYKTQTSLFLTHNHFNKCWSNKTKVGTLSYNGLLYSVNEEEQSVSTASSLGQEHIELPSYM